MKHLNLQKSNNIRVATVFSHLLILVFIILFVKFAEGLSYIHDVGSIKNTPTIVIDLLFAGLLIVHFFLIIINVFFLMQKLIKKENIKFSDVLWNLYPLVVLMVLSGFNGANLINAIKIPFNIIGSII